MRSWSGRRRSSTPSRRVILGWKESRASSANWSRCSTTSRPTSPSSSRCRRGRSEEEWPPAEEAYGHRRDRRGDLHDLGCAFVREEVPIFFAEKAPRPNRQRIALTGPPGSPILPAVSTKQTVRSRGVRCPWFGSSDNLSSLALTIPVADAEVWAFH